MAAEFQLSNDEILELLKKNQEQAIEYLFKRDAEYLYRVSLRVIKNPVIAEDLVQDVFFEFWRKRNRLNISTSIRAYLRRATINKTLNYIRDNKIILEEDTAYDKTPSGEKPSKLLERKELREKIDEAIDLLPPRARMVFVLSRFEQMSYKEIAREMTISPKTVENHISKALKFLRNYLKPHLKDLR